MARYKRYGYIVTRSHSYRGNPECDDNVGFFPSPAKANEYVDMQIANAVKALEVKEDLPPRQPGMPGETIRMVFIKYPYGTTDTFCIERWWFEVGRNNE